MQPCPNVAKLHKLSPAQDVLEPKLLQVDASTNDKPGGLDTSFIQQVLDDKLPENNQRDTHTQSANQESNHDPSIKVWQLSLF